MRTETETVIRHGDVILQSVSQIEGEQTRQEYSILAEGEVTGHKHVLRGQQLVSQTQEQRYVELLEEGQLTHEEHDALTIPAGKYRVVIQREVDLLGEVRQVLD